MSHKFEHEDETFQEDCMPEKKCVPQEMVIRNVRLAAAYVPYQQLCQLFRPTEALKRGTAFPELYSPYDPKMKKCKAPRYE